MILRTLSDRTTVTQRQHWRARTARGSARHTFIFANVLERKGKAGVLALDNAHLAEGSLADDAQQPEVVEVHWVRVVSVSPAQAWQGMAWQVQMQRGRGGGQQHGSSMKATA